MRITGRADPASLAVTRQLGCVDCEKANSLASAVQRITIYNAATLNNGNLLAMLTLRQRGRRDGRDSR